MEDQEIRESLPGLLQDIWRTMFASELSASGTAPVGKPSFGVAISFRGPWEGTLHVAATDTIAREAAEKMFGAGWEDNRSNQEDALREVTNILAGNMKAFLPEDTLISIPTSLSLDAWFQGGSYLTGRGAAQVFLTR